MKRIVLLLLLFSNITFGQVDLNRGLKAYYPFSGNANDVSGNGFHGVLQGDIQLTTDRFGNTNSAYLFDGINDGIIITDNGQLSTPAFTIAYYFSTESTQLQVCVGKINYEDGNAATYNSGVYYGGSSSFFGTMNSLNNCFARVPSTYVFSLFSPPVITTNKWYCVVNTFENGIEKMYLDGVLVQQATLAFNNATYCANTNLVIGTWWKDDQLRFKGKIDEVRYYDRALNAEEVIAMCMADAPPKVETIINNYTPITAFDNCFNALTVVDASEFNMGDTIVIFQMKGAVIDSSNTASFGTVTDYKNAGDYEFNIIRQIDGNVVTLLNEVARTYDFFDGKVQLIRVPYYENLTTNSILTCLPWDGFKGGVLVFNVKNNLQLQEDIDVSSKGFRHGTPLNSSIATFNEQGYYYDAASNKGGQKGEGIYSISNTKNYGRGASSNGGGGGNAHNSGGGGGSNGGAGGQGGDQWEVQDNLSEIVGGKGGKPLLNSPTINKLFLGGSGGMGHGNDKKEFPAGNGGGIIIISAGSLTGNNHFIRANGGAAIIATNKEESIDGMAGGGGGGSILLNINQVNSAIKVEAKGGKGADNITDKELHGPGGGGGGGVIAIGQTAISSEYNLNVGGGLMGYCTLHNNDNHDATAGNDGNIFQNFKPLISTKLFQNNFDSLKINKTITNCTSFDFKGLAFFQSYPVSEWNWNFGDGNTSNVQNTIHQYNATGSYNVTLTVTDINGCKESIIKPVTVNDISLKTSADTSLCGSSPVKLSAEGGSLYSWFPAAGLDNPNSANPTVTPLATTKYYVTASNEWGCEKKDSVTITVNSFPNIMVSNDTSICKNTIAPLLATGGFAYTWSPAAGLNNPGIANPVASPSATTTYQVSVTNTEGCTKTGTVTILIKPVATITKSADTTICNNSTVKIFADGGQSYSWLPAATLSDPTLASPIASTLSTTMYRVKITDSHACVYYDSVKISVKEAAIFSVSGDASVCTKTPHQLSASGGDTYLWTPALYLNNTNITNPVATAESDITYTVHIKENLCGETASLSTKIKTISPPAITVSKSNDITCSYPSSRLLATGATTYTWLPSGSLNNANIPDPIATPAVSTNYFVTGKSAEGCINTDTIRVEVSPLSNVVYELPNSFTPNGDGLNDCFGVGSWGAVEQLEFSIYNRMGQRVFYTNDASVCWDGKYKGHIQHVDSYVYTVVAKTGCGKIDRKGVIMLLK